MKLHQIFVGAVGLVIVLSLPNLSAPIEEPSMSLPNARSGPIDLALDWTIDLDASYAGDVFEVPIRFQHRQDAIAGSLRFGTDFDSTELDQDRAVYIMTNPEGNQYYHGQKGARMSFMTEFTYDRDPQAVSPPNESAARDHVLEYLLSRGILPADASRNPADYEATRTQEVAVNAETMEETPTTLNLQLRVPRLIDGWPAIGTGVKLYVHYGWDNIVTGVTSEWPLLAAHPTFAGQPRTTGQAAMAVDNGGAVIEAPADCTRGTIEDWSIVYHVPKPGPSARSFPVYQFSGVCEDAEGAIGARIEVYEH